MINVACAMAEIFEAGQSTSSTGRVEQERASGLRDVQRSYMVLHPRGRSVWRLIVIPRKRLPEVGSHEREWAFVDTVCRSPRRWRTRWTASSNRSGRLGRERTRPHGVDRDQEQDRNDARDEVRCRGRVEGLFEQLAPDGICNPGKGRDSQPTPTSEPEAQQRHRECPPEMREKSLIDQPMWTTRSAARAAPKTASTRDIAANGRSAPSPRPPSRSGFGNDTGEAPPHAEVSGSIKNAFRPYVLDSPERLVNSPITHRS